MARLMRASILASERNFSDALNTMMPVLKDVSTLSAAQVLLTEVNLALGHSEQALEHAQRLNELSPGAPISRLLLATVLLRKNEVDKAVALLEPVSGENTGNPRFQSVLAEAYSRSGRYEAAAQALGQILKDNPNDVDLRARIDANVFRAGQEADAIADLKEVVAADPASRNASTLLFALQVQTGAVQDAVRTAEALRTADPQNPIGDYLLGLALKTIGDRGGAREAFRSALTKKPAFMPAALAQTQLDLLEDRPAEARATLEKVLKVSPNDHQAMLALAEVARSTGDYAGASAWLDKAGAASPSAIEPALRRVDLLLAQKNTQQALVAANVVASGFRDNLAALQTLARAQAADGQNDAAAATLRQAMDLPFNSAADLYRIGQFSAALDRRDDARSAYQRAVKIDRGYFAAWRELAVDAVKAGRLEAALETAARAGAAEPVLGDAVKGQALMAAGKFMEADAAFTEALARRPSPQLVNMRVEALGRAGEGAAIRRILSDWLAAHPEDDKSRYAYASRLIQEKDFAGAIREHEVLLTKAPFNSALLNNVAWLYREVGDPKAEQVARQAYAIDPKSPDVGDTLGWILAERGELGEAVRHLSQAYQRRPEDPTIAYHLAVVASKQGNRDQALALLSPAVANSSPFDDKDKASALLEDLKGGK